METPKRNTQEEEKEEHEESVIAVMRRTAADPMAAPDPAEEAPRAYDRAVLFDPLWSSTSLSRPPYSTVQQTAMVDRCANPPVVYQIPRLPPPGPRDAFPSAARAILDASEREFTVTVAYHGVSAVFIDSEMLWIREDDLAALPCVRGLLDRNFRAFPLLLHGQQPGSTATATASTSAALVRNFMQDPAVAPPPHVSLGGRPPRRLDYDLEAGGQAHREEEEAKMLRDIFCQVYAALLPASAMSYSAFKDAPKHDKVINFGGLVIIWIFLIAGMLSRSSARRQLAFRLLSCSAVALLTFNVASQLSERTYVVLTALVGGLLNLGIMLLRF